MPAIYTREMIDTLKAKTLDEKIKKQLDDMLGKEHQEGGPINLAPVTPKPGTAEPAWYIVYSTQT